MLKISTFITFILFVGEILKSKRKLSRMFVLNLKYVLKNYTNFYRCLVIQSLSKIKSFLSRIKIIDITL